MLTVIHSHLHFRIAALLVVAMAPGCQSGVERDIVQREMRQQEDQIYALEDYLSEYQQLLCDARTENARLKQQLVKGQFREGSGDSRAPELDPSPTPPPLVPTPLRGNAPNRVPNIVDPEAPPLDGIEPGVPQLDETSALDPAASDQPIEQVAAEIEEPVKIATAVSLNGEVRLNDAESGPRVLLQVAAVSDDGQSTELDGTLSLLVLDPAAREEEQQLARWDFDTDELQSLAKHSKTGRSFQFPLQLPVDSPTDRPLELWVRLMPADGEKLLGRTTLDLGRAGQFASVEAKPAKPSRPAVKLTSAEETGKPFQRDVIRKQDFVVEQNGWQTAKPGDVPLDRTAAAKAATEWKLATRPIPDVETTQMVESTRVRNYLSPSTGNNRYDVASMSDWSPERPDDSEAKTPLEPAWSPTR